MAVDPRKCLCLWQKRRLYCLDNRACHYPRKLFGELASRRYPPSGMLPMIVEGLCRGGQCSLLVPEYGIR